MVQSRVVREARQLDAHFDPVYTVHGNGRSSLYRPSAAVQVAERTANCAPVNIRGSQRFKFYKGPKTPTDAPNVMMAPPPQMAGDVMASPMSMRAAFRGLDTCREVAIQTDYRESETQTDPMCPDYYIKPGPNGEIVEPEVLSLEHLSYQNGTLPAGLEEVKAIERAIEKREFLANLPPLTDARSYEIRRKALENQELKDWRYREKLLADMQEERLKMICDKLDDREKEIAQEERNRLLRLKDTQREEHEIEQDRIAQKRRLLLRKLHNREKAFKDSCKKDIIDRYANYGSETYAPIKRNGSVPVQFVETWEPPPNLEAIAEIENSGIPTEPIIRDAGAIVAPKFATREGMKIAQQIEKMDYILANHLSVLSDGPTKTKGNSRRRQQFGAQHPVDLRPETPQVDPVSDDSALILLQRVLRGRAAQLAMVQGLREQLQLVRELQLVTESPPPEPAKTVDKETLAVHLLCGSAVGAALERRMKEG